MKEGAIEADKKPEEVRQEPIELHKDFRWVTVNLSDPKEVRLGLSERQEVSADVLRPLQLKEVYELLTNHYVEDLDASFRFDYSPEFIEWCVKVLHSSCRAPPLTLDLAGR